MNDHLTTLARRAMQPAAIHPRGQSRFESDVPAPRGLGSLAEEQIALSAAAPLRANPVPQEVGLAALAPLPAPSRPMPPPIVQEEKARPSMAPLPQVTAPLSPIVAEPASAPRMSITPVVEPDSVPRPELSPRIERLESQRIERQVQERVEVHHERVERQATLHNTLEQRVERLTLIEPHVPTQVAPAAPSPNLQTAPVLQQPTAPRVEISIGRIEVLPLESAAAPRREEPARRPAAQTLDAYLEQRNGAGQGRGGRG